MPVGGRSQLLPGSSEQELWVERWCVSKVKEMGCRYPMSSYDVDPKPSTLNHELLGNRRERPKMLDQHHFIVDTRERTDSSGMPLIQYMMPIYII